MARMKATQATHATGLERIFIVFRGPNYDLDHFGKRLQALSGRFEGVCLIGYTENTVKTYGNFTVVTTRFTPGLDFTIRHLWRIVRQAFKERFAAKPAALVISADPLKGGLYGYLASRIIGARFAPEINGDFANEANYLDGTGGIKARLNRRFMIAVAGFVLQRADGARVLYPTQLDFLQPRLQGKIVRSIFEYVDLQPFKNLGEEKVILFAGFPFYLKGVDLLIAAFKKLAPQYPDWRLKILGWYPDMTVMNAHIDGHPQISQHGPVHHREMPEHIGRCGIFVLPSRTEAMGRVLLEAMAAEKPRIGSNVGGIPTVLEDGKDGLLFECGNAEQLAQKLNQLMSDPALRRQLGQAGRERMVREFTLERYLQRIGDFYTDVIARPRK